MDAEFPCIAECADLFWLCGEVCVCAVFDVALVDEGLEVGAVSDAVWRVDVDGLHLACHAFLFDEAVHHQQAVACNHAVRPVVAMLVELDCLSQGRVFLWCLEQGGLWLSVAVACAGCLDDGARVDAFVHVQGDRLHIE